MKTITITTGETETVSDQEITESPKSRFHVSNYNEIATPASITMIPFPNEDKNSRSLAWFAGTQTVKSAEGEDVVGEDGKPVPCSVEDVIFREFGTQWNIFLSDVKSKYHEAHPKKISTGKTRVSLASLTSEELEAKEAKAIKTLGALEKRLAEMRKLKA